MDFWGALRVLRRRWYIAVPSALLAVGLAAGVFLSIPTRYESTGVMLLTSPSAGGTFSENMSPEEAIKVNPLLSFDSSLSTTTQIIAQILADPKTREKLGITKESSSNFTAVAAQNGPFLTVVADTESAGESEALTATVLEFARTELEGQQRKLNAPESTFITSQVIMNPTTAEAKIGGKVRYAGAAFVLMMLLTLAATFASDSVLAHVRRGRAGTEQAAGDGSAPDGSARDDRARDDGHADNSTGKQAEATPGDAGPAHRGPTGAAPARPEPVEPRPSAPRTPVNGQPRRPDAQPPGAPVQRPAPPVRRPPTAGERTVKVQPTASEKTVKIAAVNHNAANRTPADPEGGGAKPGDPVWPTRGDTP